MGVNAWSLTRWLATGHRPTVATPMPSTEEMNMIIRDTVPLVEYTLSGDVEAEHRHSASISDEIRENIRLMRRHRKSLGIEPAQDGRVQIKPFKLDELIEKMDNML